MVRTHIGGRNVAIRPDNFMNLVHKGSRHAFKFFFREGFRVDSDPPFRASVWQIDNRRFPSHQGSQGSHLIEIHGGVVAKTTLHGSA